MSKKHLIKNCPTCVEYIRNHSGQCFFDHHQTIRLNLSAKRGKWHHRTKLGRNIHGRAVLLIGEKIDNSLASIAEDVRTARKHELELDKYRAQLGKER